MQWLENSFPFSRGKTPQEGGEDIGSLPEHRSSAKPASLYSFSWKMLFPPNQMECWREGHETQWHCPVLAGNPVVPLGYGRSEFKSSSGLDLLHANTSISWKHCHFPGPLCSSLAGRLFGEFDFINDLSLVGWKLTRGEWWAGCGWAAGKGRGWELGTSGTDQGRAMAVKRTGQDEESHRFTSGKPLFCLLLFS